MRIWKSSLLIIGLCVSLISSMTVTAIEEGTGDVFYYDLANPITTTPSFVERPSIDIKDITIDMGEDYITLTLETVGDIIMSTNIIYHAWFNTTDSIYHISAIGGETVAIGSLSFEAMLELTFEELAEFEASTPDVIVSENTMSATFDIVGDDTSTAALWGSTMEIDTSASTAAGWWDFAPDEYIPYNWKDNDETGGDDTTSGDNTGGDGDSKGTPGFETLTVIAALGIAFIILRRKK